MCLRQSSTSDIPRAQPGNWGVGSGGDVRWWKVREEEEGEGGGGAPLNVEVLAVLKKAELSSQLDMLINCGSLHELKTVFI